MRRPCDTDAVVCGRRDKTYNARAVTDCVVVDGCGFGNRVVARKDACIGKILVSTVNARVENRHDNIAFCSNSVPCAVNSGLLKGRYDRRIGGCRKRFAHKVGFVVFDKSVVFFDKFFIFVVNRKKPLLAFGKLTEAPSVKRLFNRRERDAVLESYDITVLVGERTCRLCAFGRVAQSGVYRIFPSVVKDGKAVKGRKKNAPCRNHGRQYGEDYQNRSQRSFKHSRQLSLFEFSVNFLHFLGLYRM